MPSSTPDESASEYSLRPPPAKGHVREQLIWESCEWGRSKRKDKLIYLAQSTILYLPIISQHGESIETSKKTAPEEAAWLAK